LPQVLGPDILLTILNFCGEIKGRKRFQKLAFLLKEKKNIEIPYRFIPYLYGPYSKELQIDLALLCSLGFVEEEHHDYYYSYRLTQKGVKFLKSRKVPRKFNVSMKSSCKQFDTLSTDQLVSMAHEIQDSR
jgi:uncharacterized protein YwgA